MIPYAGLPVLRATSVATLLLMFLGGCHPETHPEAHGRFPAAHPMRTETSMQREYVAQVRAIQHIDVRSMEAGYLEKVFVDEGQVVKKGQKMFQIMPTIYAAEAQRAAAEVELARVEYDNAKALADGGAVSPSEARLAKARLDKAAAELAVANAHLKLTEIRAPFDGLMDRMEVRIGSLLEEGELLTHLSDNHEMWVYFNVTEAEYLAYKAREGTDPLRVKLRMADGKMYPHEGVVETIEADFNNETGNIAFRATLPNPGGLLRHGESGNVLIERPLGSVVIVPQKATFEVLDRIYVFTVDEANVVHQREIKVAEELPNVFVVQSGLDERDRVLLEGQRKVRDGDTIEVQDEDTKQVFDTLGAVHAE